MRIVINSHRNSLVALNHLLDSMQRHQEFYCFDYIIAVGGYYELKDYEVDHICNIHYIKCNHNSIDFNGLLAIIEPWNNKDDYYFYMHDTCRVGDNFFRRLIEINEHSGVYKLLSKDYPNNLQRMCDEYDLEIVNGKPVPKAASKYEGIGALQPTLVFDYHINY